jgi:hypothetical protein
MSDHSTPLTEDQIKQLLAGAGPGLDTRPTAALEDALRDGSQISVDELQLNWSPFS